MLKTPSDQQLFNAILIGVMVTLVVVALLVTLTFTALVG